MDEKKFEFILFDRIEKIKQINNEYDLEHTSYLSHSGGKDSCVMSKLLDLALPNNKIPRVYKDTGIEYPQMRKFCRKLRDTDNRFIYLKPNINIKKALTKQGYPFKSKQHSHNFAIYKNNIEQCEYYKNDILNNRKDMIDRINNNITIQEDVDYILSLPRGVHSFIRYYFGIRVKKDKELPTNTESRCRERENIILSTSIKIVPNKLKYQFTPEYAKQHNFSDRCCYIFKKNIFKEWELNVERYNCFTGQRKDEGGNRSGLKCISQGTNGKHFNLLMPVSDEWEEYFIKEYNIELCELYYPPYNFKRTGCLFCPFSLNLQEQLDKMKEICPSVCKQAELIWKPVFDEYRKVGYRLDRKTNQMSIFDFMEE